MRLGGIISKSVSQLLKEIENNLFLNFKEINLHGEISNITESQSGHFYFSLKDEFSQVKCVFFRQYISVDQKEKLKLGKKIEIYGFLSLYKPRGDLQLQVRKIKSYGLGELYEMYEKTKKKLQDEGLFEKKFKKSIQKYPKSIGIITSSSGAAVTDILKVLKHKWPSAKVIIYACLVQGDKASKEIIECVNQANNRNEVNTLIIARGGGSFEDLNPFNDENLVRSVFNSKIPIITGVGHESDTTLVDYVADIHASTPTLAAHFAVPDFADEVLKIENHKERLKNFVLKKITLLTNFIDYSKKIILSPRNLINIKVVEVSNAKKILNSLINIRIKEFYSKLIDRRSLEKQLNDNLISKNKELHLITEKISNKLINKLSIYTQKMISHRACVNSLNTDRNLSIGYVMVSDEKDKIITDIKKLKHGQDITLNGFKVKKTAKVLSK